MLSLKKCLLCAFFVAFTIVLSILNVYVQNHDQLAFLQCKWRSHYSRMTFQEFSYRLFKFKTISLTFGLLKLTLLSIFFLAALNIAF